MTTGKLAVLASALAMAILLALPAVAAAQMVLPHVFVGIATLDGIPARPRDPGESDARRRTGRVGCC